ncbi:GNAT family N-acetyltransferase [Paenilisteria rocourtiae]|uniref:RimJ/RimL family protein N-acetyltransferase n=1 Tax=Listeria rocourtiae TaxID=647910 RepID=A0A4R6ZIB3_9LIST|nr:GNAT family N-acetyltransferase [Listeria rocourtiae]EUJ44512.1 acetyltransferase family protein [Listeria rocourtiae FSL F6-920]TDR52010.1 RimJ/RimL family protein N-acetyltransferase [Listeria rocourtiae]
MNVHLKQFKKETAQIEALKKYQLTNDEFSAHPVELLEQASQTYSYHCVLVYDSEAVVGFFVLDSGDGVKTYTMEQNALLLRGYSIDSSVQGRGYGANSLAELKAYVRNNFKRVSTVVLAVNKRNIPAQKLYLKSGFTETSSVVLGPRGEQFVYELRIDRT